MPSVDRVIFVHGYSETSLAAYFDFPRLLQSAGLPITDIALSAFDSLDDALTIDDLATALEDHVVNLERTRGWSTTTTAVIVHSTGALVVRRWLLNRVARGKAAGTTPKLPSHFISMAGANHGSSLAQLGKSVLGYLEKLVLKHVVNVGAGILTDLDYGSDFLRRLNREWLEETNGGGLDGLFVFSMGGDSVGTDPSLDVLWQTHETGSDNTVRICAANLNYNYLVVDSAAKVPTMKPLVPNAKAVPHLILHGYSHFGAATGIIGSVHAIADPPLAAVLEALRISNATDYAALSDATNPSSWRGRLDAWNEDNPSDPANTNASLKNAAVVFMLKDRGEKPVPDCFIGLMDRKLISNAVDSLNSSSDSILPHSPIHNDTARGSYSFYLNYDEYVAKSPHTVRISASSGSSLVDYADIDYVTTDDQHLIDPNEVTYVELTLDRDTDQSYAMYQWDPTLNLTAGVWLPFPAAGRIELPPRP